MPKQNTLLDTSKRLALAAGKMHSRPMSGMFALHNKVKNEPSSALPSFRMPHLAALAPQLLHSRMAMTSLRTRKDCLASWA